MNELHQCLDLCRNQSPSCYDVCDGTHLGWWVFAFAVVTLFNALIIAVTYSENILR